MGVFFLTSAIDSSIPIAKIGRIIQVGNSGIVDVGAGVGVVEGAAVGVDVVEGAGVGVEVEPEIINVAVALSPDV